MSGPHDRTPPAATQPTSLAVVSSAPSALGRDETAQGARLGADRPPIQRSVLPAGASANEVASGAHVGRGVEDAARRELIERGLIELQALHQGDEARAAIIDRDRREMGGPAWVVYLMGCHRIALKRARSERALAGVGLGLAAAVALAAKSANAPRRAEGKAEGKNVLMLMGAGALLGLATAEGAARACEELDEELPAAIERALYERVAAEYPDGVVPAWRVAAWRCYWRERASARQARTNATRSDVEAGVAAVVRWLRVGPR